MKFLRWTTALVGSAISLGVLPGCGPDNPKVADAPPVILKEPEKPVSPEIPGRKGAAPYGQDERYQKAMEAQGTR